MSQNYELLRRAGQQQDLRRRSVGAAPPSQTLDPEPRLPQQNANIAHGRTSASKEVGGTGVDPGTLANDAELTLVRRIFFLPQDVPQMVLFAGVERGNGCSHICSRTGRMLAAQIDGTVCLVDANLRSPSLHQYLQLENRLGLTEAISNNGPIRQFVQQVSDSNLWVLTSKTSPADPRKILTSPGLSSVIEQLRANFNYVLIDTPPLSRYLDAVLLGQLTDGVVLVLEAGTTRRETAAKAKQSLEAANGRVLAAVLNKRTFPIPEGIYRRI